ncbi:MAG: DUF2027 domain-containing protein [Muribaculum sp.]|nr:DUF2027 domain-containing protein [Muribaculum sp.]
MKPGDTVRYLNATGGGIITRIEGQIAYVEEDGFENPVLTKELVVVLPAGHAQQGARLMFDQKAYDAGRNPSSQKPAPTESLSSQTSPEPDEKVEETPHGDSMNISLAFEPLNIKQLSTTTFAAVLVNDSNYWLDFTFCSRSDEDRGWNLVFRGTVAPNELIDLAEYSHEQLPGLERVAVQAVAYKKGKAFELKDPVAISRRLDITKFHKLHCFRPGLYFDNPVLEFPLVSDDKSTAQTSPSPDQLAALEKSLKNTPRKDARPAAKKQAKTSPFKLLEPIEIDLHINALTDSTAGMQPAHMLQMQLDTVKKTMEEHRRRIGQKIIFIHGKGEGVLRDAVLKLIRREYPKAELQDASFREYGFGATLVTIH